MDNEKHIEFFDKPIVELFDIYKTITMEELEEDKEDDGTSGVEPVEDATTSELTAGEKKKYTNYKKKIKDACNAIKGQINKTRRLNNVAVYSLDKVKKYNFKALEAYPIDTSDKELFTTVLKFIISTKLCIDTIPISTYMKKKMDTLDGVCDILFKPMLKFNEKNDLFDIKEGKDGESIFLVNTETWTKFIEKTPIKEIGFNQSEMNSICKQFKTISSMIGSLTEKKINSIISVEFPTDVSNMTADDIETFRLRVRLLSAVLINVSAYLKFVNHALVVYDQIFKAQNKSHVLPF